MKRFLYLFFAIIIFSSFVVAANYSFDNDIYVNPFVFGVVKGDDGQVLTPILPTNLLNGSFQTFVNSTPAFVSDLVPIIKNNSLVVLKPTMISTINRANYLHKFYIKFQTVEYSDENINVLFKWS
jgi:hypothetical protein